MKVMTLNIWGGHVRDPLLEFVENHQNVDIFCFQEVYRQATHKVSTDDRVVYLDIFEQFQEVLAEHHSLFRPVIDDVYGLAMFVGHRVECIDEGEISIFENPDFQGMGPAHSRNLQWLMCEVDGKKYTVMNVHGLWNGQGKNDSETRLEQSKRIREFLGAQHDPCILCGDFNLRPDTKSMQMLEQGMVNLIKTHSVTSTRTYLYPKDEQFADYILVSPDILVKNFSILSNVVSDHAPLMLECV